MWGAGTMGTQIAELMALEGIRVVLRDADAQAPERARATIGAHLGRRVERGRMDARDAQARLALVDVDPGEAALAEVDLGIEAVPELIEVKRPVLAAMDRLLGPGAIVATNTSSLSVGELAAGLVHPERFLGLHFFHPVAAMRLVEVIRHRGTAPAVMSAAIRLVRDLGKLPIVLQDSPGFIVNRVLMAAMAEVLRYQEETGIDPSSVDAALVGGGVVPVGPFALADALGLDVVLHVQERLVAALGSRFAGGRLAAMVAAGRLGAKRGEGFYRRGEEGKPSPPLAEREAQRVAERFLLAAVLEAVKLLEEGVASARDVDRAMRAGAGFAQGPLRWADEQGLDRVAQRVEELGRQGGGARWQVPPLLRQLLAEGRLGVRTGQGFHAHRSAPGTGRAGG